MTLAELAELKDVSEIVKNLVEALAIFGAVLAWVRWRRQRSDRATDVLLKLERKFSTSRIRRARDLLEDSSLYRVLAPKLQEAVHAARTGTEVEVESAVAIVSDDGIEGAVFTVLTDGGEPESVTQDFLALDELLRFYVVLYGVHQARQVPDAALSACFRYWLTQYYNPNRREFARYVDYFFPTLRKWIRRDRDAVWSPTRTRFFTPADFEWPDTLPI